MTRPLLAALLLAGLSACGPDTTGPTPPVVPSPDAATTDPLPPVQVTSDIVPLAQVRANATPPTCDAARYPDLVRAGSAPVSRTVVFLDRSSTATDTTWTGAYGQALAATLASSALANGSVVDLYPLHDRTTGKAGHVAVQVLAALPETAVENELDRKAGCDRAMGEFAQSVRRARAQVQQAFAATNVSEENTRGSDVWGALQVVSEAAQDDPDTTPLNVLFLSDMMHCRTGQRCLENPGPRSAAEARAWGEQDAAQARQNLALNDAVLRRASYHVVSGDFASNKAYEFVPAYWTAFLGALGVPAGQVRFN